MDIRAKTKYLRISPKKMRLVVNVIKGMDVKTALDNLSFIPKKASTLISKTLKSAIANAEHNFNLKKDNLFIKEIFVDSGPVLKRWRARAFGRAAPIRKKSSHLSIILEPKGSILETEIKKQKPKEPVLESTLKTKKILSTPVEEKIKSSKKQFAKEKGKEIFDVRRTAKKRSKQHMDKIKLKKIGGRLKQMFRRKSI